MKPKKPVTFSIGILVILLGLFFIIFAGQAKGIIPLLIGASLIYLGVKPGRKSLILLGHTIIVVGCMLVTWGLYLLPHSKPIMLHIFFRPLFWGLVAIFGGICAIYQGFCRCIHKNN